MQRPRAKKDKDSEIIVEIKIVLPKEENNVFFELFERTILLFYVSKR